MKKIAVIQDLSGLGRCSLTAAIPVISAMGVQACPLPTAVLSNQTGYESYFCDDYTEKMSYFTEEWKKRKFRPDGIYTGFLASAAQIEQILTFTEIFRTEETILIVDPVMGDNGIMYPVCDVRFCERMERLLEKADVITPNLTEAFLLLYGKEGMQERFRQSAGGISASERRQTAEEAGRKLCGQYGLRAAVVTGIDFPEEGRVGNLIVSDGTCRWVCSEKYGGSYSGTGDLFTSVVSAGLVNGETVEDCVRKAVRFLEPAIRETAESGTDRNDGVCFEKYLCRLWE